MNRLFSVNWLRKPFSAAASVACFIAITTGSSALGQSSPPASPAAPPKTSPSPAATDKETGERLVSLVLLLSAPRKPSHDLIAHAVSEGLGTKISADAVVTKPPYHLVNFGADKFVINDIDKPYFEDSAKVADEIKNPNLSRAVRDHRAWISVDWVSTDQQADLRKVYQMIGKMVAHLSAKDTLAVYSPDMDQFALWAPTVRQGLESDDPLGVFEPAADPNAPAQTTATPSATPE